MFKFWASIVLAVIIAILVATDDSSSNPQEILGRSYSREAGRLFEIDRNGEEWTVASGIILVRFAPGASAADISSFQHSNQVWPAPRLTANAAGYRQFRFSTDRDPLEVLTAVVAEELVQDACLDTEIKFYGDPYFGNQWNLQKMRADKAWEITRGDSSTVIAIIDTGVDYLHEDLVDGMWRNANDAYGDGVDGDSDSTWYGSPMVDDFTGWDFRSNDNTPLPDTMCIDPAPCTDLGQSHGTSVAGVALATCDNDIGVAGACGGRDQNGPKLMTLRVYKHSSNVANAIEYAWRKGATVVNMSFGVKDEWAGGVAAALDSAAAHGVIVVAAVGNTLVPVYPASRVAFPASYPSVIAVGASDENDLHWRYSCMGPEVDLVAPSGGNDSGAPAHFTEFWTTDTYRPLQGSANPETCVGGCPPENDKYYSHFGYTSAASPEVASIAALLKSRMPGLTPAEVRQQLYDSAVDLGDAGPDTLYGYGRVDAYRALTEWGTITGNVTWRPEDTADSTRYVSGDLTIASGATLTIMPGTTIKIANDDDLRTGSDTLRVEINVEGALIADGTSANPVVFESWDPTTTEDWVGFYFKDQSGGGTFDHCDISRAETAIESYVPLTLTNSVIHDCGYAAVMVQDGASLIQGCTLTNPGVYGINLAADTTMVRGTTVDGASATALHVASNAAASVRTSQFVNCDTGLYHSGHTRFADIDSNCVFSGNTIGMHCYDTGTLSNVLRSSVHDNNHGIACDEFSHPVIRYCTVEDNGMGILCTNASEPSIRDNRIRSNDSGVVVATGGNPDIGTYSTTGLNTITANVDYHVVNYNEVGIVAQNNSWGKTVSPCGPKATKLYGAVDVSYPLCYDPNATSLIAYAAEPPRPVTGISAIVPNPFNPTTTVHYSLAAAGVVRIRVYDVAGRLVRELVNRTETPGDHAVPWSGVDRTGNPVASGIYFVKMDAGRESFTRKMVLLK